MCVYIYIYTHTYVATAKTLNPTHGLYSSDRVVICGCLSRFSAVAQCRQYRSEKPNISFGNFVVLVLRLMPCIMFEAD